MAIKFYPNIADYNAAVKGDIESQVSLINTTNEIIIDGVNVVTSSPSVGDAVFLDGSNNIKFLQGGDALKKSSIPSAWDLVGVVYAREGNLVKIFDKKAENRQFLAVWQYAITEISSTIITIRVRMAPDYDVSTEVSVSLLDTTIGADNAGRISNALAAKAIEVGDANPWWAFYDADANKIVIQTDKCVARQQSQVSGSGLNISLDVWGDMPAYTSLFRNNKASSYLGGANYNQFYAYYEEGGETPTADISIKSTTIVNKNSFENSEFCQDLRDAYASYGEYIQSQMVMYPQQYGVFSQIQAALQSSNKYGAVTVVLKNSDVVAKYPAYAYVTSVGYPNEELSNGKWYLEDVDDCLELMRDAYDKVRSTQSKLGISVISNTSYRWLCRRSNANNAWVFYGGYGSLSAGHAVYYSQQCRAVTLLTINS